MNFQDTPHFNFSSEQVNNAFKGVGIICVGVLTLLLLTKTINEVKTYATIGEDSTSSVGGVQNSISVSGQSEMFVRPDITTFTWTVTAEDTTADASESKAAAVGNKAIAFLKSKGVAEADMKTASYYTIPTYGSKSAPCDVSVTAEPMVGSRFVAPDGSPVNKVAPCSVTSQVVSGYTTSQSVEVKVRDIKDNSKKTGELIAGLSAIGALSSTPISTVDKPELYKQKVRDEAIFKARQQAEVLAKALGVKLVRVMSFNESSYPYPPMMYDTMSARGMAKEASVVPELPVGTNKIVADVTIQYQIR